MCLFIRSNYVSKQSPLRHFPRRRVVWGEFFCLAVRVNGPPGETVAVSAVALGDLRVRTVSCVLPRGGVALASFTVASSSCSAA